MLVFNRSYHFNGTPNMNGKFAFYFFVNDYLYFFQLFVIKPINKTSMMMNNKIPQQKTFMILKEAETLDYIPLKVTSSMGLMYTPVFSIFRFLEE